MNIASRHCIVALLLPLTCGLVAGTRRVEHRAGAEVTASGPAPPADYWPTTGWRESTPEAQGVNSAALADAVNFARAHLAIHSLLLIRHGRVVLDAAFYPYKAGTRHDLASVTKSVTSILIGAAERRQKLVRSLPLAVILPAPARVSDHRRSNITIESLLGMQSGLDCGFRVGEAELDAMTRSADWIRTGLTLPMRSEPGTEMGYCSVNYHLLSAVLSQVTGQSEEAFARQALFGPLGITDVYWPADPQGLNHGWGDLQLTPRDAAKIGYLMLHGGSWAGREIVTPEWVTWSTAPHASYGMTDCYAHGWWTHRSSPPRFFEAVGRGGQRISVWPAKDVVIVETGGGFEPGELTAFLLRALAADAPLPANPGPVSALRASVQRAAGAPSVHEVPPLPPIARVVSGRTYLLGTNPLGLHSISVRFEPGAKARVTLALGNRRLLLPTGLDGLYRLSTDTIEAVRPAARGEWTSADEFKLDLNLVGKINRYTMGLRFGTKGSTLRLHLMEATGTAMADVAGAPAP